MRHLAGLREYLEAHYQDSVFAAAHASGAPWTLHLHGSRVVTCAVRDVSRYEIALVDAGAAEQISKHAVQFLYPADRAAAVAPLLKVDAKVRQRRLEPILTVNQRHHVKNKSLFPLMMEKTVVFFTTLGGDVLRGLVDGFTRYEITVKLKGGVAVTLLRHAVFDCRDKHGRSHLKAFQQKARDWQRCSLWLPVDPAGASPENQRRQG